MGRKNKSKREQRIYDGTTEDAKTPNYSSYVPPSQHYDTIDHLVQKVDQEGTDKYRTMVSEHSDGLSAFSMNDRSINDLSINDRPSLNDHSINNGPSFPSMTSTIPSRSDISSCAPSILTVEIEQEERKRNERQQKKMEANLYQMLEDQDYYKTKQQFAYVSITISAIQLAMVMMQLALCGVAPLDVNPFVGPYPDSISEWGGKNAYLLKFANQWWRFITPAFLHVGILHLMVNVAVQLETAAFFEREWGSMRFLWLYIFSEVGCIVVSSSANPDTLAVGSSGALMGLFGAKLAQVFSQVLFENNRYEADAVRLEQLSSILCTLSVIMALSFFTYIDWSGHMGGLATGFATGMVAFSRSIVSIVSRSIWQIFGLVTLLSGIGVTGYYFYEMVEPDSELENACEYFRGLYSEGYDCTCQLFG